MNAAEAEFLEKGFGGTSIRSIGARAGVSGAALYRHFRSKEDLFSALVEPGIAAMRQWQEDHRNRAYANIAAGDFQQVDTHSEVDMMREVVFPHRTAFKLLMCCGQGTRYENFIHDVVEVLQPQLVDALSELRSSGYAAAEVDGRTLHMLLSAFMTALFEPIVHDYPEDDAMAYYKTMERFFLPGWKDMLGT